jgi:hypothetical protein
MSPAAVEAASDAPADTLLEPHEGLTAAVVEVVGAGVDAAFVLDRWPPLEPEPHPAAAPVIATAAATSRIEARRRSRVI